MTRLLFILSIILFSSCNFKKEENAKTINPKNIQISEVMHNSLTKEQIQKIEKIQSTLAEVHSVSLEETINIFKRDQNPESEINIWLQIANTYEWYLNSKTKQDLKTKQEVFRLILSRSMMSEEEAISDSELEILTEKEAKEILSHYTLAPE
jgi:outer membrane lipoprotein-sorting protein